MTTDSLTESLCILFKSIRKGIGSQCIERIITNLNFWYVLHLKQPGSLSKLQCSDIKPSIWDDLNCAVAIKYITNSKFGSICFWNKHLSNTSRHRHLAIERVFHCDLRVSLNIQLIFLGIDWNNMCRSGSLLSIRNSFRG